VSPVSAGARRVGAPDRAARVARVRARLAELGVDALCCSLGADLPWLTGYEAMPLERLTMLVLPVDGEATLVVPELEAPRVADDAGVRLRPWREVEDPAEIVAGLLGPVRRVAISDRTWAAALLALQRLRPEATWLAASLVTGPLRAVKDDFEVASLAAAAAAADRVAHDLQSGEIALRGRSEVEVAAEIHRRLLAEGHRRVDFAIVASGPNGASPHHEPGQRVIEEGDLVVCDFGGALSLDGGPGYCSDITRTVAVGEPGAEAREVFEIVRQAQAVGTQAARIGTAAAAVDAAARERIDAAGYGSAFLHRLGHGIGLEGHEDPYLVNGNTTALVAGHVFSIEPGIYLAGRFGVRIEDIVVATADGPVSLNQARRDLVVVDA